MGQSTGGRDGTARRVFLKHQVTIVALLEDFEMPHDIAEEGREAFMDGIPLSDCPYTDEPSVKAWEHGWQITEEEMGSA